MEKSIENIWKDGFLKSDALVAPSVNKLYSQKSTHLVDKLIQTGKLNLIWIVIGGMFFLTISFFAGVIHFGVILFLLLISIVLIGLRQSKELKRIDKTVDSYQYIMAFYSWLQASLAEYERLYKFMYPAIITVFFLGFAFSDLNGTSLYDKIMTDPDTYFVNGIPIVWVSAVVGFIALVAIFSRSLYKFDIYIIYGEILRKLNEIISDMEELRNSTKS